MKNNYNKQMRNIIASTIDNISNYYYKSVENAILMYEHYLYQLFDYNHPVINTYKHHLCNVAYIDAYIRYKYKHKKLLTNNQDIFEYHEVSNIFDHDDLIATISADPMFFAQLLKASYYFNYSNGLSKILMIKSLSDEDKKTLLEIAPSFQQDLLSYDKKIFLEDILINYKNQNQLYNKELDLDFDEAKIETIYGFIKELSIYDIDNAKDILKKIAKIDNKVSNYLKDKVIDINTINNHINIYNLDEETIIKELLYNKDFLIDAIWMVIDACINHNYNEINLDESLTKDILTRKKN